VGVVVVEHELAVQSTSSHGNSQHATLHEPECEVSPAQFTPS
jgi:hypothetical protein